VSKGKSIVILRFKWGGNFVQGGALDDGFWYLLSPLRSDKSVDSWFTHIVGVE
jgi:hypothetical protein